jgi:hypothetical protein
MGRSTLKRPPQKLIDRFHVGQVGNDTIGEYLEKGWSLVICCQACPKLAEWTPPELVKRFVDNQRLQIADLVPHLVCKGVGGCGSKDIAVFPHAYDGDWAWPPPAAD